ncbi:hypothetical protein MUK42_19336 [Musa troglodytarum]|uniref:Uncharacterized protein n=1 Tax=Musa troglodytarum TaxID=320322 RepID=A0A9E7KAF5_9LILI|nr:hypothetical protein MUK42_19336 [Musa troglodytarum]
MGAAEHHQQNRALVDTARLFPNPSRWTETSSEKYRSTSLISKSPIIHHALPNWTQTSNSLPCFPFAPVVAARIMPASLLLDLLLPRVVQSKVGDRVRSFGA